MARRPGQETDEALMDRAQTGDVRAFAELVLRYQMPMFNLAYRMLRDRHEAEDVAQETFLHLFRAIERFHAGERFSPWLYRIAMNLCLDKLRRYRGAVVSLDAPVDAAGDLYRQVPDAAPGPAELVELGELKGNVQEAVDELPDHYRVVVILRHLHDLTYDEIARTLEMPIGTVKTRLFRAREMLRQRLSETVGPV
jgi:RNA polymerase sigma-70 factor (ECF subfamily)